MKVERIYTITKKVQDYCDSKLIKDGSLGNVYSTYKAAYLMSLCGVPTSYLDNHFYLGLNTLELFNQ